MNKLLVVLGVALAFSPVAMASDIAFYVGMPNTEGWYDVASMNADVATIIAQTGYLFKDIQQFDDNELNDLGAWVDENTDDGELDIIWLNGATPSVLYGIGNTQPNDSRAELWLDGGNMIINVGDWFAYVSFEGGTRQANNTGTGAANILDLSSGIIAGSAQGQMQVTATGREYLPSLNAVTSERPVQLSAVVAPWEVAAIFAQNSAGTYADPVVIHNTETGGYLAIVNQGGGSGANWIDDRGLTCAELIANWVNEVIGLGGKELATVLSPENEAVEVPRESVLSWAPGEYAATHDVYLGMSFADVNAASRANPLGVLISQGQVETSYDPAGALALGQTYYWRVDEVNAPPTSTIYKGKVWSFTVEPVAYQVENITASAPIPPYAEDQGPEKTVDGSGLDDLGQHSVTDTDMWQGDAAGYDGPVWIQYDFDTVYKLHEMKVWNYNHSFEPLLGFGAKNVTIEYTTDGSAWETLGDYEWARATGKVTYTGGIVVDFGGVAAQAVRININEKFGTMPRYGLSEVQFFYIPIYAREIEPADGQSGVGLDVTLSWRAGREAVTHEVYFSDDREAVESSVALADVLTQTSYNPSGLEFGKQYYWRITEVNEAGTPSAWPGAVMSLTTREYDAIDDFESYTDDEGNEIFSTWIDGYGVDNNGSQVGNDDPPYAEQSIVHGGEQSMPLRYDNTGTVRVSVAENTFPSPQNWAAGGADTLLVHYRGNPIGLFPISNSEVIMSGIGADIWDVADEFRFAYTPLNGNGSIVAKVESIDRTDDWAKVGVMIRETLAPSAVNAFVAVTPSEGVVLQYRSTISGTSSNVQQTNLAPPYWVKLTRSGNQFTAQRSADGVNWVSITDDPAASTVTIPMATSAYIGLAVCSHDTADVAQARFSNVAITGAVLDHWQDASIGLDQPVGNVPDAFSLTVTDSAGHATTLVNPDPYAVGATSWSIWRIPLSLLTSAGINTASVAKMAFTIGDAGQAPSGATGRIYLDDIQLGRPMVHSAAADVTAPDDTVVGVPNDGDWPANEAPRLAVDNSATTKFLHFKGELQPTGVRITPVMGASIVTGLTLTTANDSPGRDPIAFELYGSNDGINGPYTLIASGDVPDFAQVDAWPRFTKNVTPIEFENSTAYTHYQLLFPAIRDVAAGMMQIAEVELIGTLVP
ncbi:MAG: discoidin domain-containing protein [Sedimentisphaerales bacterium]|nr:discoidin domain-containing protein [Sedimentisphaerales bacterium]